MENSIHRAMYVGKEAIDNIERDKVYKLEITMEMSTSRMMAHVYGDRSGRTERIASVEFKAEKWADVVDVTTNIQISNEDIDDIVCGAIEGGITYWCSEVEVPEDEGYLSEYASEQISRGGTLILHDNEEGKEYTLTRDGILNGIRLYLQNPHPYDITEGTRTGFKLDTCQADAVVCDMIVQYALFGEVIYG